MGWTIWTALGALWGGLAVIFGAFGAHLLKTRLTPDLLQTFELAARYQMYHALALLCVGQVATRVQTPSLIVSGTALGVGSVIFSGSLYILVFSGQKWLGMVTPIGGVLMIVGWFSLAFAALSMRTL